MFHVKHNLLLKMIKCLNIIINNKKMGNNYDFTTFSYIY